MFWILQILEARPIRWIVTIAWMIFLTILLVQPETQQVIPTGIPPAPPSFKRELLFTCAHLAFFSITGLLWCFALEAYFEQRLTMISVALFILSYGFVTEMAQNIAPGRTPQITDMAANLIGGLMGIAVYHWWKNKRKLQNVGKLSEQSVNPY